MIRALWGRRRPSAGRHRRGAAGLTWCGELPAVAVALAVPAIAHRGLFETFFSAARHATASYA